MSSRGEHATAVRDPVQLKVAQLQQLTAMFMAARPEVEHAPMLTARHSPVCFRAIPRNSKAALFAPHRFDALPFIELDECPEYFSAVRGVSRTTV